MSELNSQFFLFGQSIQSCAIVFPVPSL